MKVDLSSLTNELSNALDLLELLAIFWLVNFAIV